MRKLYICHTIYHIYITLIKEINFNNNIDIILSDNIPKCDYFKERLSNSKIFNNITIVKESLIDNNIKYNNILEKITYNRNVRKNISKYVQIEKEVYDDIYIFNDNTKIGYYLITSLIKYNLIEDGLNSLTIIDKYIDVNYSRKIRILSFLNLYILCYGQSLQCKSIEVNNKEGLKIPNRKIVELPREQLLLKLSEENKKDIYSIFINRNSINIIEGRKKNSVLLLTEPLYIDKRVETEEEQINIYSDIINNYIKENENIFIKAHPRDYTNYLKLNKNITIIEKDIPMEVLNFNSNITFDKVITITSTAINGIQFAKEKVILGFEYLDTIK